MRPVNLPPPPVPGVIDAIPGVCRGGIYASRQGCAPRGVPWKNDHIRRFVGRAFTPAANIAFFLNHRCGGVCTRRRVSEVKRRAAAALRPEIKTPSYNTKQTPNRPGNGQCRTVSAGGIYAAPTHGPNAVTTKKRVRWVYGCGPHACGPYRPRYTPYTPYPGSRRVLPHRKPKSFAAAGRATTIFHFYFLIFNFLKFSKVF